MLCYKKDAFLILEVLEGGGCLIQEILILEKGILN